MELNYFSSGPRERVLRALLDADHRVLGVFVTDPAIWSGVRPTMEVARERGLRVRVIGKAELGRLAIELAGQTCLSVGFAFLFPEAFIGAMRLCLNVHGTLLPKYAGLRTLNWVLENGDPISGVTVHQIDAGVDTGPILLQRSFPVSVFDSGRSLYRKTLEFEPSVVLEALAEYESGAGRFRPQELAGVKRYPDRVPEHSRLDPSRPLRELYDQIRAADPDRYPAHFYLDGEKVCVKVWRPVKPARDEDMI
jgi:methionyl-tRNA formyltransferase